MIRSILPIGSLILLIIIYYNKKTYSQIFIAGQYNSGCYYYDFNPDTTIVGPCVHISDTTQPAIVPIDINGDGVNDVFIYSFGWWVNGWGYAETSVMLSLN